MGFKTYKRRAGDGKRWNIHRLATPADTQEWMEKQKAMWEQSQSTPIELFRAEMKLVRAETRTALNMAIEQQMLMKLERWKSASDSVTAVIAAIKKRHTLLNKEALSKVCDVAINAAGIPFEISIVGLSSPLSTASKQFEQALLNSDSMAELAEAKAIYPELVRREVMSVWMSDGRYDWLLERVASLRATG